MRNCYQSFARLFTYSVNLRPHNNTCCWSSGNFYNFRIFRLPFKIIIIGCSNASSTHNCRQCSSFSLFDCINSRRAWNVNGICICRTYINKHVTFCLNNICFCCNKLSFYCTCSWTDSGNLSNRICSWNCTDFIVTCCINNMSFDRTCRNFHINKVCCSFLDSFICGSKSKGIIALNFNNNFLVISCFWMAYC